MAHAKCTVTISNDVVQCDPGTVVVTRGIEKGIRWKLKDRRYKFTGVVIGGHAAPEGDFGPRRIRSTITGRSVMKVSDRVSQEETYSYTLTCVNDKGQPCEHEPNVEGGVTTPQIKNQH